MYRRGGSVHRGQHCLIESVYEVVLQKSIPTQIRKHIRYMSNDKRVADGFVGESTFAKRLYKLFL